MRRLDHGHKRIAWCWGLALLVVIALALAPFYAGADGGRYPGTAHGNTTNGAQRDPDIAVGSCKQCHDAHGATAQDFGLWTTNNNSLCFTCHSGAQKSYLGQTLYAGSGHATSVSSYDSRAVGLCVQCHNPHGAGDSLGVFPHLTKRLEEQTCYTCHGLGPRPVNAADIESQALKPYAHRANDYSRIHDDWTESNPTGTSPNPGLSGTKRHAECSDCHNTHMSNRAPRTPGTSNIGEALLGSWGVKPVWSVGAWTSPSTYLVERFQNTATHYEAYLCFKCHSKWAWGNTSPLTTDGMAQTDQALEFNPNNPSYHNVTGQPTLSVPTDDLVFGTANPPAYLSPWGPNSAMACTDCHTSDPSVASVRGPHGSIFSNLLQSRYKAVAGAPDNTGRTGTQNDLCFKCHDFATYGQGEGGNRTNFRKGSDNLHQKPVHSVGCFQCHSAVPHGYQRKHMMVYVTDGPPYFRAGARGIMSWTHANGGAYEISNCTTTAGCHQ